MESHSYSEVWRAFDETPLSHSSTHYLLALTELRNEFGYARITDVAKRLGLTKGSVSISIKALRAKGLVDEDPNHMLRLTSVGEKVVANVIGARTAFLKFFHEILGIEELAALEDSCKLEHLVSHETTECLIRFVDSVASNTQATSFVRRFKEAETSKPKKSRSRSHA
jgi:DtxR family transcriptional regulator, Mn-dependent transcriptional regulator